MGDIAITAFNNGEVSPHIDTRSDVEKYAMSCRTLENMIPLVYGDVTRRPGTQYIGAAKLVPDDGGNLQSYKVRLIPFVYSATVAYMCEFGQNYIRFYWQGTLLTDGSGTIVEVATPYVASDLASLQYRQIGDVMWLTHAGYPVYQLQRTTATSFTLTQVAYNNGPFLVRNDLDSASKTPGISMACSATTTGSSGTLTITGGTGFFQAGHVGSLWKLVHNSNNTVSTLTTALGTTPSPAIPIKGTFSFNTHGTWTATVNIERQEGTGSWDVFRTYIGAADRNLSVSFTEASDNVNYRLHATSGSLSADLTADTTTQEGIVRVTAFLSSSSVTATVIAPLAATTATLRWAEGAWSDVRGYPGAVAFFEDRLVLAGTDHQPQTVWFTAVDDFANFEEGVNDSDSFSLTLADFNRIIWLDALDTLAIGTTGNEWRIASTKLESALTPTNFNARQQSTYGSSNFQPARCDMSVLFVDYVGRKVREYTYSADKQQYVAPDMAQMAEHITLDGITAIALQRNPEKILWCVRSDGTLLSMTYERAENVVAWARHPFQEGAIVESVGVIPGAIEDEVWLSIYRGSGRSIERMGSRYFAAQEDCFYVDCGYGYAGPSTTTVSGLTWLEGQTVSILADGAVVEPQVVTGGTITLLVAATSVSVGLPFQYTLEPMRIEFPSRSGSTQGSYVKIAELAINFLNTGGAMYGPDLDHLTEIEWRTGEALGNPPALFTGFQNVTFDGGFDPETPLFISGTDPLPCTVRSIVARAEKVGR